MRGFLTPWAAGLLLAAAHAQAQCYETSPFDDAPGIRGGRGINDAALWDPDGPGPRPPVIVAVGAFSSVGPNLSTRGVAVWTGEAWEPLDFPITNARLWTVAAGPHGELAIGGGSEVGQGGGCIALRTADGWDRLTGSGSAVDDLFYTPAGELIACGSFRSISGTNAANIARGVGHTWSALGGGLNGEAYASATTPNGDIIAGGFFTAAGGNPARSIARWDGSAWSALGEGFDGPVLSIAARPDGSLFAAGHFTRSGPTPAASIAAWDGSAWSALGAGFPGTSTQVWALAIDQDGSLFAGGDLGLPSGVSRLARWDGQGWTDLSRDLDGTVGAVLPSPGGPLGRRIYTTGLFSTAGGWPAFGIASWAADGWLPTSTRPWGSSYGALAARGNDLLASGIFYARGEAPAFRIARRAGDAWVIETAPVNGQVRAILPMPDGSLIAGGDFSTAGGAPALRTARWDGSRWSPLGSGFDGALVFGLARLASGEVAAAGSYTSPGGASLRRIALWDGARWRTILDNIPDLYDIAALPDGGLVACVGNGVRALRFWNGAAWRTDPTPVAFRRLAVGADSLLYAMGEQSLWRSDGSSWTPIGHGVGFAIDTAPPFAPAADEGVLVAGSLRAPELGIYGLQRSHGDSLTPANAGTTIPAQPTALVGVPDGSFGLLLWAGAEFSWVRPTSPAPALPRFTEQPAERTAVCPGAPVTLTASAEADGPVQYTWSTGPSPFSLSRTVGTGPTLTVTAPADPNVSDYYWCTATTGPCATTQSASAVVHALFLDQDRDGSVGPGDWDTFLDRFEHGPSWDADFNADGVVDFFDLMDFADALDRGC